jgi:TetR/AcrR family transcriptional repressor of mexJK operon
MSHMSALKMTDSEMSERSEPVGGSRLETRRRAFMNAANAAFLEKGYASTTLGDIIAKSGGSRQTLYALFGGKQGLFEAIVTERNAAIFRPLRAEGQLDRAPEDVLVEIGARFLQVVLTPDALSVFRLVVAEGPSMRELSERFWALGPARTISEFESYFAEETRRGVLNLPDAHQAARQFQGILLGNFHMQCLLGMREIPSPEEIEAFVRAAVTRFLDGSRGRHHAPRVPVTDKLTRC